MDGRDSAMKDLRAKSGTEPGRPGELLTSHLLNTLRALRTLHLRIGPIPGMPPDFWQLAAWAALLHDTGKWPRGFQRMIGNTAEPARPWGERHEVLSLGFIDPLLANLSPQQRLWIAGAVAGHHRPFTAGLSGMTKPTVFTLYGEDSPEDFLAKFTPAEQSHLTGLLRWLRATAKQHGMAHSSEPPAAVGVEEVITAAHRMLQELRDRWAWPVESGDGLTAVLLLGAVTMADHISSAHGLLDTGHPLTADYPAGLARRLAGNGHALRPQQRQAAGVTGHLLLRSWTGSGKTEAVLLWASTQVTRMSAELPANPRVFYLLPYLASINAMTDRLREELDSEGIGVAHSKAASYHLARSLADECDVDGDEPVTQQQAAAADKAHSRAEATRNFRELLRVGTPYQLLRGALAGPVHSSILTDSANSVFVLDELHAYDTRRLGMMLAALQFWHRIGGRVAVMSATLPTVLATMVTEALDGRTSLVQPPGDVAAPVRHRLHTREAHLTDASSVEEIAQELTAGRSVLVVANNVRDAITLYQALEPVCTRLHGEGSAHLLHSRFRRRDRNRIEQRLRARFASGAPRVPGLLVGTQAIEVSLDIDLDRCHTSAADLEALIQRFGRVNRLAHLPPSPVIVHQPAYTTRRNEAGTLWADGVSPAEPTRQGWDILTRHDGQTIDEPLITAWLDQIYASPWGQRWEAQVRGFQAAFQRDFLTFTDPFEDRSRLTQAFDALFDGTEAVLDADLGAFTEALTQAPGRAGRLLADDFLIPVPHWADRLVRWDPNAKVRVIRGIYDSELGLTGIHGPSGDTSYQPGEVL
ncbi:CRISPR-associated helicase Cas3' [Streptomyces specialis]|uniref:CRISPR-associated helicase Cas3' n=1 Tax=Streptomyces specialis TaxID=498367 RepID=UPI000A49AA55|nr:CRISPR-associated helicase Cas3' [Streptomyces specialis]